MLFFCFLAPPLSLRDKCNQSRYIYIRGGEGVLRPLSPPHVYILRRGEGKMCFVFLNGYIYIEREWIENREQQYMLCVVALLYQIARSTSGAARHQTHTRAHTYRPPYIYLP